MSIRDIPFQTVQAARKAIEVTTGLNLDTATEAELFTISNFVRVAAFNNQTDMMAVRRFNVEYKQYAEAA